MAVRGLEEARGEREATRDRQWTAREGRQAARPAGTAGRLGKGLENSGNGDGREMVSKEAWKSRTCQRCRGQTMDSAHRRGLVTKCNTCRGRRVCLARLDVPSLCCSAEAEEELCSGGRWREKGHLTGRL